MSREPDVKPRTHVEHGHGPRTPFGLATSAVHPNLRTLRSRHLRLCQNTIIFYPATVGFSALGGPGGECAERGRDKAQRCDCVMNPQADFLGTLFSAKKSAARHGEWHSGGIEAELAIRRGKMSILGIRFGWTARQDSRKKTKEKIYCPTDCSEPSTSYPPHAHRRPLKFAT